MATVSKDTQQVLLVTAAVLGAGEKAKQHAPSTTVKVSASAADELVSKGVGVRVKAEAEAEAWGQVAMLDLYADLSAVFFGPDFAAPYTRRRPGADDLTVMVVIGAVDEKALDGRAMSAVRVAHFAAGQDVRAGDKLVAQQASPDTPAGTAYRVLDAPSRLNDGLEMEALLGSATA